MQPSMYLPAWEKLKEEGELTLVANPILHSRLDKALRKRKDRDKSYRLYMKACDKSCVIKTRSEGAKLIFRLKIQEYISDEEIANL